jgi:hypothetical protein
LVANSLHYIKEKHQFVFSFQYIGVSEGALDSDDFLF